ncbi:DUF4376 domain-containing protein [Kaistia sp. MMO-174]|uniref:DUF4376 domain-containing protein n=1 Tax=Kaistia sp. MMO-174 TaxID=3081256 RepID=UPI003016E8E0
MSPLYFASLVPWQGERIDGVLYPPTIADLWTGAQLAAIGLYRPLPADPVPQGKRVLGTAPQWVDGVMRYVHTLEDVPISPEEVDAERDRRTEFDFTFAGVAYQVDDKSISRIIAMGTDARFAQLGGAMPGNLRWADANNDFGWIATDNSITPMDAQTMAAFADAAKLWVSQHIFAARALKDAAPIPADYVEDGYWPG